MTPGTQPQSVKIKVIKMEPQPLSNTAKGGQMIDNITRQKPIMLFNNLMYLYDDNFIELLHIF